MKPYIIFDAHCDSASRILDTEEELWRNQGHLDLARMLEYQGYIQCFAAFIAPEHTKNGPMARLSAIADYFASELVKNEKNLMLCSQKDDVKKAISNGKAAAILTVEGGEAIEGNLDNIPKLAQMGFRAMALTWNFDNDLATGCLGNNADRHGLTPLGRAAVTKMEEYNMIPDVSHLSEKSFWDVVETARNPITATHSNSAAVYHDPNRRNLTDKQFQAILNSGGVVGINLYSTFLSAHHAGISDILSHIEHFLALGGENAVGLGCDFDGIDSAPKGIHGIQNLNLIFEEMARLGYSDALIQKISHQNFLRLFGFEI